MINELDLLWVPDFIVLTYISFWDQIFWNKGIDTCFKVECVLLGRNFDFLGGCCSLPTGLCWLLVVIARYWSFPLLVWTSFTWIAACLVGLKMNFCPLWHGSDQKEYIQLNKGICLQPKIISCFNQVIYLWVIG